MVYWLTDTENDDAHTTAWRLGGAPWDAKLIKLADIIDNIRTIIAHAPDAAPKFLPAKRLVLQHMLTREGDLLRAHPLFQVASMYARSRGEIVQLR